MKRTLLFLLLGIFIAVGCYSVQDSKYQTSRDINQAISLGQVSLLAEHMAPDIEFNIQNSKVHISKEEAAQVMQEFFRQNKPSEFICDVSRNYISGNLITSDGKQYKVDYTLKMINNQEFITGLYVY